MERVRVTIGGRVQGVFFRTTCARLARDADLAGSVRNLPDGRVEAVFEGTADEVRGLVAWCRHGPDGARVDDVEIVAEQPTGETGFRIVH